MQNRLNIIDALKAAREAQGLTQAELASRANTSRVTVGRIEAGFDPKLSTVYELARALGLEITLVPKSLADEVRAFLRSGGRSLAQPVGASAPPSVVDLAAVVSSKSRVKADLSVSARRADSKPQSQSAPARRSKETFASQRPAINTPPVTTPAKPTKRTGKPMISASAAKALGLNLDPQAPDKKSKERA